MMIIVLVDHHELFLDNPDIISRVKELRSFILNSGYHQIFEDDINTIFVSDDIIQ